MRGNTKHKAPPSFTYERHCNNVEYMRIMMLPNHS